MPLVEGKIQSNSYLLLIQDGAPSHAAGSSQEEISRYGILKIDWPYLSDSNLIESVWDQMKAHIDDYNPEEYGRRQRQLLGLREFEIKAWNSITSGQLIHFIKSIPGNF